MVERSGSQFDGWLTWRLQHGSHDFPGPDGGTCINEAAVVVAGFGYREVTTISDLPESFCPVISQFCLTLNDSMPEGEILNRLRPFAVRLSGSSDTRAIAMKRAAHLALSAARDFAALALEVSNRAAAKTLRDTADPVATLAYLTELSNQSDWPDDVEKSLGAAQRALTNALAGRHGIYSAELCAISAIRAAAVDPRAWDLAIATIDSVMHIGRQADLQEAGLIDERAKEARNSDGCGLPLVMPPL